MKCVWRRWPWLWLWWWGMWGCCGGESGESFAVVGEEALVVPRWSFSGRGPGDASCRKCWAWQG